MEDESVIDRVVSIYSDGDSVRELDRPFGREGCGESFRVGAIQDDRLGGCSWFMLDAGEKDIDLSFNAQLSQ